MAAYLPVITIFVVTWETTLEIGAGGSVSGGGVAVAVGSGGSLFLIGVPVVAEGVAVATHGAGVTGNA